MLPKVTHCLVVGISDYEPSAATGQEIDLNGCVWDAKDVMSRIHSVAFRRGREFANSLKGLKRWNYLRKLRKGKVGPIRTVQLNDSEATAGRIRHELEQLCRRIKPGEAGLWFRSGHGTIIRGAYERDGTDEAFCAYDALNGGYVIDNQINAIIEKHLNPKAHLYIIADTCHAGDSTRDVSMTRKRGIVATPQSVEIFRASAKTYVFTDRMPANVTALYACADDEYSYEQIDPLSGKVRGVYTLNLAPHIPSIIDGTADLDEIHRDVSIRVSKYNSDTRVQTPQLERYRPAGGH